MTLELPDHALEVAPDGMDVPPVVVRQRLDVLLEHEGAALERFHLDPELQRSMDYFESTYGLGHVQKLLLFPQLPATDRMLKYLQNYVAYEMDFIDSGLFRENPAENMNSHCFAAYCAALRGVHG